MEKAVSFLKAWAIEFVRNKDLVFNKIEKVDEEEGKPQFTVHYKDKTQHCFIVSHLSEIKYNSKDHVGIFTFHTDNNFKTILDRWNEFSSHPQLTIYSVNPFIHVENKWILQPYHHAKIADKESFKTGMKSMFSAVTEVREQDLKR